ncbi:MAG: dipicolinate synthase subunit DpsA [Oscillospiraceae bacterium]|jgi:dipicolinate synthase subunit A|nr:dipicolinate synthase subunit DpsA [Oscillospiraceae bacterium]
MTTPTYKFGIIGGDMRQRFLAEGLHADGHRVSVCGLENSLAGAQFGAPIQTVCAESDILILPLPALTAEGCVAAPLSNRIIYIADVFEHAKRGGLILAGRVDRETRNSATQHSLTLIDYFDREEMTVRNALATAEGAVQILMEETSACLAGAKILILGYGRIGKLLARSLDSLNARVTVSARKESDRAWVECFGYSAVSPEEAESRLGVFDIIVNTVPSRVMTDERLQHVRQDALILDLASKPGGIDFQAAQELNLRIIWALSLPGRVAPKTSGDIIRKTVYCILKEQRA